MPDELNLDPQHLNVRLILEQARQAVGLDDDFGSDLPDTYDIELRELIDAVPME